MMHHNWSVHLMKITLQVKCLFNEEQTCSFHLQYSLAQMKTVVKTNGKGSVVDNWVNLVNEWERIPFARLSVGPYFHSLKKYLNFVFASDCIDPQLFVIAYFLLQLYYIEVIWVHDCDFSSSSLTSLLTMKSSKHSENCMFLLADCRMRLWVAFAE